MKPDATPEELTTVANDDSGLGDQVFAQAVSIRLCLFYFSDLTAVTGVLIH